MSPRFHFHFVWQMSPLKAGARRAAAAIILLLAFTSLGVAWSFQSSVKQMIETWQHAVGTVTHVEEIWTSDSQDGSSQLTLVPHIRFTTADGRVCDHAVSLQSNILLYDVGEKVELLYPSGNPHDAEELTIWGVYFCPFLFSAIGVLLACCGVACFLPELFPHRFRDPHVVYLESRKKAGR